MLLFHAAPWGWSPLSENGVFTQWPETNKKLSPGFQSGCSVCLTKQVPATAHFRHDRDLVCCPRAQAWGAVSEAEAGAGAATGEHLPLPLPAMGGGGGGGKTSSRPRPVPAPDHGMDHGAGTSSIDSTAERMDGMRPDEATKRHVSSPLALSRRSAATGAAVGGARGRRELAVEMATESRAGPVHTALCARLYTAGMPHSSTNTATAHSSGSTSCPTYVSELERYVQCVSSCSVGM